MAGSNTSRKPARTRITSKEPLFPEVKTPAKTGPKGSWKMTPETLAKLEQAFAIDATVEEASFYAGINAATYYRWRDSNPELCEKLEGLRHTPVLTARQTVINAIKNDPDLALKYLERKRKKEFSTKSETDVKMEVVTPILSGIAKQQEVIEGEVVHPNDND